MAQKRIVFTGGSGKAGKIVVPYLLDAGYRVINGDLVPHEDPRADNIITDITNSGQVFNLLSMYANFDDLDPGKGAPPIDAVVHFAAVPRILITPDNECFRVNTMGTYNVIEAAVKLGIRKIIIASSETTYALCFADGKYNPSALPLTEDDDVSPHDSYALSKVCNEATARAFQARSGADIYALRIGNVWNDADYANLETYLADPGLRRRNAFNYIDAKDLGQIVDLCIRKDGLGYQIFNACNDTNVALQSAAELAETYFPGVALKRPLEGHESLMSNHKVCEMLGFTERHNWRDRRDGVLV